MSAKKDITVVCYGKAEHWSSREKAKTFYLECMACSEGAERDRYVNIFLQLEAGNNYCVDEL